MKERKREKIKERKQERKKERESDGFQLSLSILGKETGVSHQGGN